MKAIDLMELVLRKNPLVTIDESLDKYSNDPIPQIKIDKCNNVILNTNLLQVLEQRKKERKKEPRIHNTSYRTSRPVGTIGREGRIKYFIFVQR
ncbi:MAG: hypothetical protein IPO37_07860 [Saprospiraceae bacterium]|nr:hypothetical protein [Saprospiraceae bacterium]